MKQETNVQIQTVAQKFPGTNRTDKNIWATNATDAAKRTTYCQIAPDHPTTAAATVGNRVIFALLASKQKPIIPTPDQTKTINIWPRSWHQ